MATLYLAIITGLLDYAVLGGSVANSHSTSFRQLKEDPGEYGLDLGYV